MILCLQIASHMCFIYVKIIIIIIFFFFKFSHVFVYLAIHDTKNFKIDSQYYLQFDTLYI